MITPVAQRWREQRESYRPIGEPFDPSKHEVAPLATDNEAKAFVLRHHYAGTYPAARFRFGLYRSGDALVGVAVFSQPVNDATLRVFPCERLAAVELGRIVLLDEVKSNGESWFIGEAFRLLRAEGIAGVVSFSDPTPRTTYDGRRIFKGHYGGIYQATNGIFAGRGTARTLRLLPDGTVLSARAIQKVRAGERGWRYAVEQLMRAGAPGPGSDLRTWLRLWLPKVTRPLRHPGNFRYLWGLQRAVRRALPPLDPSTYPKFDPRAAA